MLTFGSLFTGIGGFDLGFESAGMRCAWQVEIDPFCVSILERKWPNVRRFSDVKKCGREQLESVDVICAGFPCQPHSVSGKRRGARDDRNLWPETRRIISEIRPDWVVLENVTGLLSIFEWGSEFPMDSDGAPVGKVGDLFHRAGRGYADKILEEIEALGYDVVEVVVPACAVGAQHRRDRVWIIANNNRERTRVESGERAGGGQGRQYAQALEPKVLSSGDRASDAEGVDANSEDVAHAQSAPIRTGLCKGQQGEVGRRRLGNGGGKDGRGRHLLAEPGMGGVIDGIPEGVDGYWGVGWEDDTPRVAPDIPGRRKRLSALGNSVVPQVAELFARLIIFAEDGANGQIKSTNTRN